MPKDALALLRERLSGRFPSGAFGLAQGARRIGLGCPEIDARLGGGLIRAAAHEVFAERGADAVAATGFSLALACRALEGRPLIWVRQERLILEAGAPYPPGLAEIGLDPATVVFLRVRDAKEALQAGVEAGRCAAIGATLMEIWGEPKALDLTASRKLVLAATSSGAPTLIVRAAATPAPSAATTRWRVRALASRAFEANAPGLPAFDISLLRQRGGEAGHDWRVEWNRDRACFELQRPDATTLPRFMAAPPADGAAATQWRRAG